MVIGDLNAQIGKEKEYRGTIGMHSLHEVTNDNGTKLIDFAMSKSLVISSTFYPHKDIHKRTWKHPDGVTFNQIDHVLIDSRFATGVLDVKTLRGANSDSDHYLVRIKYRCKINFERPKQHEKCTKFNMTGIREEGKSELFQTNLKDKYNSCEADEIVNVEDKWTKFKEVIITTAEEAIGYQKKKDNREWFDQECQEAVDLKNKRYAEYVERSTRTREEGYKEARRRADKICRTKKRAFLNQQIQQIEEDFKINNT